MLLLNSLYVVISLWLYIQLVPIICPNDLFEASICFAPWFLWLEEILMCLFLIIGLGFNFYFFTKFATYPQLKQLTRILLLLTLLWIIYLVLFYPFHFIYQAIAVLITLLFKAYNIEKNNQNKSINLC